MRKTKIIATLGPSTLSPEIISELINSGMDLVRLNMSHYSNSKEVRELVKTIKDCSKEIGKYVGILMDLCGPKIRIKNDISCNKIKIKLGQEYTIGYGKVDIPLGIKIDFNKVKEEPYVKIDDGRLIFRILKKKSKNVLLLQACTDGFIYSGKGVNFPGIDLDLPCVTEKDISDLKLGLDLNVDWFALSFVRSAEDRNLIDKIVSKQKKKINLIAKIEKPEAIQNLRSIVDSFDGILIARGDLGVETSLEIVPILQKRIISICNEKGCPVITATQMLESMIESEVPTRAEVGDIASSIYDGTDGIMLSGETAIGRFPVETLRVMDLIAMKVEGEISKSSQDFQMNAPRFSKKDVMTSICHSAFEISNDISTPVIVVMTESGSTAQMVSNFRPNADIIALSPNDKHFGKLCLYWGVNPFYISEYKSIDQMLENAESLLIDNSVVRKGQKFVFIAGVPVGVSGSTNLLKVQLVGSE